MPGGAAEQRAEEMAALDGVLHARGGPIRGSGSGWRAAKTRWTRWRAPGGRDPPSLRAHAESAGKIVGGFGAHDVAGAPGLGRGARDERFRDVCADADTKCLI